MKPGTFAHGRLLLIIAVVALTIGLVSWGHQPSPGHYQQTGYDTVPKKQKDTREKKVRDLDDVIEELNEVDLKVDAEKIRKEIAESMKEFDAAKIKLEIEKAMKEVDMEKIQREVEASIAKVDFDKIKKEMAEAMKELDAAKIQQEIQASMAKVDWEKMKNEMQKVKEIDMSRLNEEMKKMQEELAKIGPEVEKSLEKAKVEIEKARAEMKEYKEFVDGLEKDGLIDKKSNYKIKHRDGVLEVNGKKVADQTYNKYRSFLEKHKSFTIDKDEDDFDIDMD